jgi:hypothetical protein
MHACVFCYLKKITFNRYISFIFSPLKLFIVPYPMTINVTLIQCCSPFYLQLLHQPFVCLLQYNKQWQKKVFADTTRMRSTCLYVAKNNMLLECMTPWPNQNLSNIYITQSIWVTSICLFNNVIFKLLHSRFSFFVLNWICLANVLFMWAMKRSMEWLDRIGRWWSALDHRIMPLATWHSRMQAFLHR